MRESATIKKYNHPILFYALSTAIPWILWFAAGYVSYIEPYDGKYMKIASLLAFAGLLSPLAVVYFLVRKNKTLLEDIKGRFFNFTSVRPLYLLLACFIMPVSILLAQLISLFFGYSPDQFIITGNFTFSSGIFPVWGLLIIAPIIEELAWHTYGTDSLWAKYSLFKASMIFGVFWGLWHLPLAGIRDYYQSNLVENSWVYGLNFLISIIPFVLIMNWLYYKTGRNIIITIIFHITAGFFNELFAPHPDSKVIQTGLLLILASYLVIKDKKYFFK